MPEKNEKPSTYFDEAYIPDPALDGYWNDIVADERLKAALFNFCLMTAQLNGLSRTRCGLYRFVLLYGGPGTGKTSMAIGCANKVAGALHARTGKRTKLLQVNVSAWFSEFLGQTVKAVREAFQGVRMAAARGPVTLLLDEVESLGMERSGLGAGDPSDVIRGVNAFLTELDSLRRCENALVLATSNLRGSIDHALWDRADLKIRLGMPSKEGARRILAGSAEEMAKVGATFPGPFLDAVVNALYDGSGSASLSGRDLSRVLTVAVCVTGKKNVTTRHVVQVAKWLMAMDGKEDAKWKC
jgi:SpoVK/Ycf46/Vps4 family AAA+-type ATPase